jgi:hypothetical protein
MVARDNITANRLANCAGKGNGKSLVAAPMRPENQEGIENKRLTPDGVPQTSGCFKKKAGAGEAGFGFLQFGDVERGDVESCGFDEHASLRK